LPSEYTFVPWLRRGVAAEIAQDDTLGSDPDAGLAGRATLPVELTLSTVAIQGATVPPASVARDIAILGPGDVADIKREAILRTQPVDGAVGVTPGELAYVEFYDEDFPWRYTPARAATSRLRPWLALLVLTDIEFTIRRPAGELAVLTPGPRAVLPPITGTWSAPPRRKIPPRRGSSMPGRFEPGSWTSMSRVPTRLSTGCGLSRLTRYSKSPRDPVRKNQR